MTIRFWEDREIFLNDRAVRIFLNTRGTNDTEVSRELVDFLHYLERTDDESAERSGSENIRKIHDCVKKIKSSEEMGVKYMQTWEEKALERLKGRNEGKTEGRIEGEQRFARLVQLLMTDGNSNEIILKAFSEKSGNAFLISEIIIVFFPYIRYTKNKRMKKSVSVTNYRRKNESKKIP